MNSFKKVNKLSDMEKEIVLMLKSIENDEAFIIASVLVALEDNTIDELYDFLKANPDLDSDDVLNFLLPSEDGWLQISSRFLLRN